MFETSEVEQGLVGGPSTMPDEGTSPAFALIGFIVVFLALKFILERATNIQFAEERLSITGIVATTVKAIIGIILFKTGVAYLEGSGVNTGGTKAIAGAL